MIKSLLTLILTVSVSLAFAEKGAVVETLGIVSTTDVDAWKKSENITVMSWNIWGRQHLHEDYLIDGRTMRDRTVEIIKRNKADIVLMIETYGGAKDIAEELGFYYYTPNSDANLCIFSRYPLSDIGTPSGLSDFSFIHATATLESGKRVRLYTIWLTSNDPIVEEHHKFDETKADKDFVDSDIHRINALSDFFATETVQRDLKCSDEIPLIIAGDFNWFSHLDYNEQTKALGLNQRRVIPAPTSLKMAELGFVDTFRTLHPLKNRSAYGYTSSTVGQEYTWESERFIPTEPGTPWKVHRQLYGRIDYIYSKGESIKPVRSYTECTYKRGAKRLDFPMFPSDHGAVVTRFILKK